MLGLIGIRRHDSLRAMMSSYLDEQLTEAEATRFERHLSGCEECRAELDDLEATAYMLRELPELELPRSLALASVPDPAPAPWYSQWVPTLATSLVGVLLVVLIAGDAVGILSQAQHVEQEETVAAASEADASTAAAGAPMVESAAVPQAALGQANTAADTAAPSAEGLAVSEASADEAAPAPMAPQAALAQEAADETAETELAMGTRAAPAADQLEESTDATEEATESLEAAAAPAAMTAPPADTAPAGTQTEDAAVEALEAAVAAPSPMAALAVEAPPTGEIQRISMQDTAAKIAADQDQVPELAVSPDELEPDEGIALPLLQLEIALGALLALLASVTFWTARRPRF